MNLLKRVRDALSGLRRPSRPDPPRYGFSYSLYWMKVAREWDPARREAVAHELRALLNRADFVANQAERRFTVPGVEGAHSGGSLVALDRVLQALSHYEEQQGDEAS